jgi:hypothetical protein
VAFALALRQIRGSLRRGFIGGYKIRGAYDGNHPLRAWGFCVLGFLLLVRGRVSERAGRGEGTFGRAKRFVDWEGAG